MADDTAQLPPDGTPETSLMAWSAMQKLSCSLKDAPAFDRSMQLVNETEQPAFRQWLYQHYYKERQVQIEEGARTPALSAQEYIEKLKGLDFKNNETISDFKRSTYQSLYGPPAEIITLGVDSERGIEYFFRPGSGSFHLNDDLEVGRVHQRILTFAPKEGISNSPLLYGLYLGQLRYGKLPEYCDPKFTQRHCQQLPISLYLNVADKSIWLVLEREWEDEIGSEFTADSNTSAWEFMPSQQGKLPDWDLKKLYDEKEISASSGRLDLNDDGSKKPFVDHKFVHEAYMHALETYVADAFDVWDYIHNTATAA